MYFVAKFYQVNFVAKNGVDEYLVPIWRFCFQTWKKNPKKKFILKKNISKKILWFKLKVFHVFLDFRFEHLEFSEKKIS